MSSPSKMIRSQIIQIDIFIAFDVTIITNWAGYQGYWQTILKSDATYLTLLITTVCNIDFTHSNTHGNYLSMGFFLGLNAYYSHIVDSQRVLLVKGYRNQRTLL